MIKLKMEDCIQEFKDANEIEDEIDDDDMWYIIEDNEYFHKLCEDGKYMKNWGSDERLTPVYDEFHTIIGAIDNLAVHYLYHAWRSIIGCCDYWMTDYQLLVKQHPFGIGG